MTEKDVLKVLNDLEAQPTTKDDWRDLYDTIEAYKQRCLARAIAASPQREALVAAIRELAGITTTDLLSVTSNATNGSERFVVSGGQRQFCAQPGCSVLVFRGHCRRHAVHDHRQWYYTIRWSRMKYQKTRHRAIAIATQA